MKQAVPWWFFFPDVTFHYLMWLLRIAAVPWGWCDFSRLMWLKYGASIQMSPIAHIHAALFCSLDFLKACALPDCVWVLMILRIWSLYFHSAALVAPSGSFAQKHAAHYIYIYVPVFSAFLSVPRLPTVRSRHTVAPNLPTCFSRGRSPGDWKARVSMPTCATLGVFIPTLQDTCSPQSQPAMATLARHWDSGRNFHRQVVHERTFLVVTW